MLGEGKEVFVIVTGLVFAIPVPFCCLCVTGGGIVVVFVWLEGT